MNDSCARYDTGIDNRSVDHVTDLIRLGVIGTGIGITHIEVFRQIPGTRVAGVASADRLRAERVATAYGLALATDDYRELLTADFDALVIAAPPALHPKMVDDAVAAGKHIFCEKPLSLTLAESWTMLNSVKDSGLVHFVNFHLRYTAAFRTAANLVRTNMIGPLTSVDAHVTVNPIDYLNASFGSPNKTGWFVDPAQGGGLLRSSGGPHLIDLMLWLGGNIESVAATTMTSQPRIPLAADDQVVDVSVDDGFAAIGRYSNGAIASMRGIPVSEHRTNFSVSIHGERGSLYVDAGQVRGMLNGEDQIREISVDRPQRDARHEIADAFITAIRTGDASSHPDFVDGARTQAVLEACAIASCRGSWVSVDLDQTRSSSPLPPNEAGDGGVVAGPVPAISRPPNEAGDGGVVAGPVPAISRPPNEAGDGGVVAGPVPAISLPPNEAGDGGVVAGPVPAISRPPNEAGDGGVVAGPVPAISRPPNEAGDGGVVAGPVPAISRPPNEAGDL